MIPFNYKRDAAGIEIGKEQQTAGDDDGLWNIEGMNFAASGQVKVPGQATWEIG